MIESKESSYDGATKKLCAFYCDFFVSGPHKINVGHIHFLKMHIFCVKKILGFFGVFLGFFGIFHQNPKIPKYQNLQFPTNIPSTRYYNPAKFKRRTQWPIFIMAMTKREKNSACDFYYLVSPRSAICSWKVPIIEE